MADKASFLGAYSPWSSRSTTPKPNEPPREQEKGKDDRDPMLKGNKAVHDNSVVSRYQLSSRDYPKDCPKLTARWFYATDAPKRRPQYANLPQDDKEPPVKPKKYSAFSTRDSSAIEKAFQELVERDAAQWNEKSTIHASSKSLVDGGKNDDHTAGLVTAAESDLIKVPVNEDFLFDVIIQKRELRPAYWLGPNYDVRRGSWFYQEGSNLRPCDENLAGQLEQGYLKIKPWEYPSDKPQSSPSSPKPKSRPTSTEIAKADAPPQEDEAKEAIKDPKDVQTASKKFELRTQRLFGAYMNSVVTYTDSTTAWILTDDLLSRMSSTVYQRFAGGGHLGGVKVVRGYLEANKGTDEKKEEDWGKRASDTAGEKEDPAKSVAEPEEDPSIQKLERQMSNIDPAQQKLEAQQQDEREIKEHYKQAEGEDQGREVEHLILVTHGIGQKLGLRLEMLNFIADCNTLRKTIKAVYQASPDLQMLNSETQDPNNCRIQVLPVVWRHQLNFPDQSFKKNKEQDVADSGEEEDYPSLENISLEPPTMIRMAIRDLGLDILMYQSAYREHISETVVQECNRVYKTFTERNPKFKGKVSLIGHSLGSAIMFDVLCHQKHPVSSVSRSRTSSLNKAQNASQPSHLQLNFDVEDYYCLGSPLGLYQMLNGRKIIGMRSPLDDTKSFNSPVNDPFLGASATDPTTVGDRDSFSISKSAPKCAQLFNIFHPADPIAYRLEPLISTAMASLKPQPLPYTKKGLFDVQGQGLSAIGNRVSQSVSGLWSSVTGGMAASLLNRTLGMPPDATTKTAQANVQIQPRPDSRGKDQDFQVPPTLIDGELETLYAGFEKSRRSKHSDESKDLGESGQMVEAERRGQRLRREEAKVRALNSNGRVDFAIQTGVFDMTNPINSIASHLSYWSDEDVSHFMISQLLSRQRVIKR